MSATLSELESRVRHLEGSLRGSRRLVALLGSVLTILAVSAMLPQERKELEAARLVLTDADGAPAVVLLAGPGSSLLIETPSGQEVLRLGGPLMRRIGK